MNEEPEIQLKTSLHKTQPYQNGRRGKTLKNPTPAQEWLGEQSYSLR